MFSRFKSSASAEPVKRSAGRHESCLAQTAEEIVEDLPDGVAARVVPQRDEVNYSPDGLDDHRKRERETENEYIIY